MGLLPLYGAAPVLALYPPVGSEEILTVGRLVTQAPRYHAGVVEVHADVMLVSLQYLACEERCLRWSTVAIAEAVALLVGLGTYVDAVLVAQVIPLRIVRIVTRPHGIHIQTLHYLYVLYHPLTAHHITAVRVHLVSVNTFYQYGLTVHQQLAAFYLYAAEPYLLCYTLRGRLHEERI